MIRALGVRDLEAYVALRKLSLREAAYAFSANPERDVASDAEFLRGQLAKAPDWMLFGAFDDQELAGAAGLIRDGERASLWGMYVAPQHRGTGLGRALLDACLAHAKSLDGVTRVELAVKDEAAAARALYESAGFRPGRDGIFSKHMR